MPLSEYEQRVLEQMERQLHEDDPKLASSLEHLPRSRSVGRVLVGVFGVIAGLVLLIVGVSSSMTWIGIVGFILMFAAVTFAVIAPRKGPVGVVEADATVKKANKGKGKKKGRSMMSSFEERWEKRRRGQ